MTCPIETRTEWGMILTVDPAEFSPDHTYTFECEVDGTTYHFSGIRPQIEEDGHTRVYLPLPRQ